MEDQTKIEKLKKIEACEIKLKFLDYMRKGACQTFFKYGLTVNHSTGCSEISKLLMESAAECYGKWRKN